MPAAPQELPPRGLRGQGSRRLIVLNGWLAFVLEHALLGAAIFVGLHTAAPPAAQVAIAVALPTAIVAVWALFLAPRASSRLRPGARLLLQAVLFCLASVAVGVVGEVPWAVLLGLAVTLRLVLGVLVHEI